MQTRAWEMTKRNEMVIWASSIGGSLVGQDVQPELNWVKAMVDCNLPLSDQLFQLGLSHLGDAYGAVIPWRQVIHLVAADYPQSINRRVQ